MQRKSLPKPPRDNKQVQEYTRAVKRGQSRHLVVPTGSGWSVRRPAAARASGNFASKSEAVAYAKKTAALSRGEVLVFSRSGKTTSLAPKPDLKPPRK